MVISSLFVRNLFKLQAHVQQRGNSAYACCEDQRLKSIKIIQPIRGIFCNNVILDRINKAASPIHYTRKALLRRIWLHYLDSKIAG